MTPGRSARRHSPGKAAFPASETGSRRGSQDSKPGIAGFGVRRFHQTLAGRCTTSVEPVGLLPISTQPTRYSAGHEALPPRACWLRGTRQPTTLVRCSGSSRRRERGRDGSHDHRAASAAGKPLTATGRFRGRGQGRLLFQRHDQAGVEHRSLEEEALEVGDLEELAALGLVSVNWENDLSGRVRPTAEGRHVIEEQRRIADIAKADRAIWAGTPESAGEQRCLLEAIREAL